MWRWCNVLKNLYLTIYILFTNHLMKFHSIDLMFSACNCLELDVSIIPSCSEFSWCLFAQLSELLTLPLEHFKQAGMKITSLIAIPTFSYQVDSSTMNSILLFLNLQKHIHKALLFLSIRANVCPKGEINLHMISTYI